MRPANAGPERSGIIMRILLVEDRQIAASQFSRTFNEADVDCEVVTSQTAALAFTAGSSGADVIIISLPLEAGSALDLIADIRSRRIDIGILVMQEMRNSDEAADLLDVGADDVISKPVHNRQIISRLRALVRRQAGYAEPMAVIGCLTFYFDGRSPTVEGKPISLTPRENSLLECLVKRAGRTVAREVIYTGLYGNAGQDVDPKIIDVYICKLRKKLGAAAEYIDTAFGTGYRLDAPANNGSANNAVPVQLQEAASA